MTLVKQQRVDATVNDNLAVAEYTKTTSDTSVKIAAKTGDTSEQVFAMRQDDTALRDAINTALDEVRADGTLATISQKYFGTDVSRATPGPSSRRSAAQAEHLAAAPRHRRADGAGGGQGHHPADPDQLRPRPGRSPWSWR